MQIYQNFKLIILRQGIYEYSITFSFIFSGPSITFMVRKFFLKRIKICERNSRTEKKF